MLVRSSSYQSQYIFGKDFHLRRLQKVTTESFPPAGGNRKLIGHGIYVYIYIHCRLPRGKRIVWQNGFVLHRMGTVNSPRCGLLGNDLQDHIWIPGIPGILVSSAVGSGERQRCGTTFRLETLVLSHVHLFVCVLCVCFPIGATIHRKFWHLTFAHWVAAAKRTGGAKSHGVFCMWC